MKKYRNIPEINDKYYQILESDIRQSQDPTAFVSEMKEIYIHCIRENTELGNASDEIKQLLSTFCKWINYRLATYGFVETVCLPHYLHNKLG